MTRTAQYYFDNWFLNDNLDDELSMIKLCHVNKAMFDDLVNLTLNYIGGMGADQKPKFLEDRPSFLDRLYKIQRIRRIWELENLGLKPDGRPGDEEILLAIQKLFYPARKAKEIEENKNLNQQRIDDLREKINKRDAENAEAEKQIKILQKLKG